MLYLGLHPKAVGDVSDLTRQFVDVVYFLELVEDPVLSLLWRILQREREALYGVANRQETSSLATFPIRRERYPDYGLSTEAVQGRAKALVKVEAGQEPLVAAHLVYPRPEHDALHDISRSQSPHAACEHDVVRVVDLRLVIPASRLPRERKGLLSTSILDREEPFRNVDAWRTVLSHGPKLQEVSGRASLFHCIENVERSEERRVGKECRSRWSPYH